MFSLSQMSRAKLVYAMPWPENIGEANVKGTYALLLCRLLIEFFWKGS